MTDNADPVESTRDSQRLLHEARFADSRLTGYEQHVDSALRWRPKMLVDTSQLLLTADQR
jgi:hypothetical protein